MIASLVISAVFILIGSYGIILIRRGNAAGVLVCFLSIAAIYFSVFPNQSNVVAQWAGVGRGADLLIYLAILSLVVLIVLVHARFRKHTALITELARHIAIGNAKKEKF